MPMGRRDFHREAALEDLPWKDIPALLEVIAKNHDSIDHATVIDVIRRSPRAEHLQLGIDPAGWAESVLLRQVIGDLANAGRWIKRMSMLARHFSSLFQSFRILASSR
jgi:hypothetical protein